MYRRNIRRNEEKKHNVETVTDRKRGREDCWTGIKEGKSNEERPSSYQGVILIYVLWRSFREASAKTSTSDTY
jgi:hypothetical protein